MALCSKTAVTDESTPPESANITLSLPSSSFKLLTVDFTKEAGVQLLLQPQIFKKLERIFTPSSV